MTMESYIDKCLESLKRKGYSNLTIDSYRREMQQFTQFLWTAFDQLLDQLSCRSRDIILPPKMHPCIFRGPIPASVTLCHMGKPGTRCPGRS